MSHILCVGWRHIKDPSGASGRVGINLPALGFLFRLPSWMKQDFLEVLVDNVIRLPAFIDFVHYLTFI